MKAFFSTLFKLYWVAIGVLATFLMYLIVSEKLERRRRRKNIVKISK